MNKFEDVWVGVVSVQSGPSSTSLKISQEDPLQRGPKALQKGGEDTQRMEPGPCTLGTPLACGQNDGQTRLKHYLPATTLAGGKNIFN